MNRVRGSVYLAVGIAAVCVAMLMPVYLRSVDESVIERAGATTRGLLAEAGEQARLDKPGLAMNLVRAAGLVEVPGAKDAIAALQQHLAARPISPVWGGTDSLLQQVCGAAGLNTSADSVLAVILPAKQRSAILRFLQGLRRGDVQEVLRNRDLKEPVVFPPVASASGQALDAGILLTGLLLQADAIRPAMRQEIERFAAVANRGGDSSAIELVYLNLSSLAKRMTWDQLIWFLGRVRDLAALRDLTAAITRSPTDLPVVFSAMLMAESPDAVVEYLRRLPKTALGDLRVALKAGKGGLDLLLARQQPIVQLRWRSALADLPLISAVWTALVGLSSLSTVLALLFKYLLWFDGAFCLARAFSLLRPEPGALEAPLRVAGTQTLVQQTIGVLAVAVAVVMTEPGLARIHTPIQPVVWLAAKKATPAAADVTPAKPVMKGYESNYLALGLFFLVQAAVYAIGRIKLREIKRQEIPSALKIRILDNEENLFDTGLYVGLGGTGIALVLLALNLFEASPMIAYSSTGFGVFFASLLKIVHVRSYRRRLIMEAALEHARAAS
jgi:hypothetical protein